MMYRTSGIRVVRQAVLCAFLGLSAVFGGLAAAHAEESGKSVAELERARSEKPRSVEVREALGRAYYQRARASLDQKRFDDYERDLGLASKEWIEAVRLAPESPGPHTWMGIAAAYQGNLDAALKSFAIARRLEPRSWVAYTNIAQTMIYKGNLQGADKFLDRAERLRADPTAVMLNRSLSAWREGRIEDAEWFFEEAYALDPEAVQTFDEAPVSEPIRGFGDYTRYCCANPSCGPHMADACRAKDLAVETRQLPEETARRELQLEIERQRELKKIYEQRRDLNVEIEVLDDDEPKSDGN